MIVPQKRHPLGQRMRSVDHPIEPPALQLIELVVACGKAAAQAVEKLIESFLTRPAGQQLVDRGVTALSDGALKQLPACGLAFVCAARRNAKRCSAIEVRSPFQVPAIGRRRLPGLLGVDLVKSLRHGHSLFERLTIVIRRVSEGVSCPILAYA